MEGGIITDIPSHLNEVDVIIVGGGTAGCVLAARISDADTNLSVLVIEGGKNNYQDPGVRHPMLCVQNLSPASTSMNLYTSTHESQIAGRQVGVQTAGMLGGGSSVNIMTYSRALCRDFDDWETPGWTSRDMIPYLKKFETHMAPESPEAPGVHGDNGPIKVSRGPFNAQQQEDDFIRAANKLGVPEVPDLADLQTAHGVHRSTRYISPEGIRQDAAHAYLHPRLRDGQHPQLQVIVRHQVVRVLFDGDKKAIGVELRPNPRLVDCPASALRTIKARKTVVLSSGTLSTPLILERSGVGATARLQAAGVPDVVADVPGVGGNFMDHFLVIPAYNTSLLPGQTLDAYFDGRLDVGKLMQDGDRLLGWNAADVTSKLRPSEKEAAAFPPALRTVWEQEYKMNPDKPLIIITPINFAPVDPAAVKLGQYITGSCFSLYPKSRGRIHIAGPSMDDPIDFQTGFLSDEENVDIAISMWAYKKQREIIRRMQCYRGEIAACHPVFSPESDAAAFLRQEPLPEDVKDIVYTSEDDAVLEKWIRETVASTWHSLGTCKMAPREALGVVDSNLNVYGVQGLKVVDLSIVPQNVGANTANTAFAVGERAADILMRELVG